jgi:type 1 glutamine amidotransferase
MRTLCSLLLLALPLSAAPVRVLILSGANNHEWRQTTPHIKSILEASGRFEVKVTDEPSGLTGAILAKYDLLLADYCGPRWGETAEKAVEAFVKGGKGLVIVHAASYPFGTREVLGEKMTRTGKREPPWPAWGEMVGAVWTEQPMTGHGQRHIFQVKWTEPQHPIAAGLPPSFTISDELYHLFQMKPNVNVLARAFDDTKIGGTGKDEPILWTVPYGQGRVFHTALGHDLTAQAEPGFQISLARGAEWAATGAVTIPAKWTMDPKDTDAVSVLLVTGGHDHEASLYPVFEHMSDIKVNVDPHPVAFRNDLRKRYDVVVLYDMVQELPDVQKKNLRDYVESGKGLVVLHHAIADYQNWEWWWKEVVGGRYVLTAEPGYPASSYLHDVDLEVRVVAKHPVTKGLGPAKIVDETYKNMWHSPEIKVLVETEHPTSDKPLVWISPYPKSKVVYIELGHGREGHENAWFRQLVRNAILWSGGRAKE